MDKYIFISEWQKKPEYIPIEVVSILKRIERRNTLFDVLLTFHDIF